MRQPLAGLLQDVKSRGKIRDQVNQKPLPHRQAGNAFVDDDRRHQKTGGNQDLEQLLLRLHLLLVLVSALLRPGASRLVRPEGLVLARSQPLCLLTLTAHREPRFAG